MNPCSVVARIPERIWLHESAISGSKNAHRTCTNPRALVARIRVAAGGSGMFRNAQGMRFWVLGSTGGPEAPAMAGTASSVGQAGGAASSSEALGRLTLV